MNIDYAALIEMAFDARNNSVCGYSGFAVGAALLCEDGEVYTGTNIECAAFSATVCAERTAIFSALAVGERNFRALVVVGGKQGEDIADYCPPCGLCRQVIAEFCNEEGFELILAKSIDDYAIYSVEDLLPLAFTAQNM